MLETESSKYVSRSDIGHGEKCQGKVKGSFFEHLSGTLNL